MTMTTHHATFPQPSDSDDQPVRWRRSRPELDAWLLRVDDLVGEVHQR